MNPGWLSFDHGNTIGTRGSENGFIVYDEEFVRSSRITLEKGSTVAPWSITCSIYGWMVHTRYIKTSEEANREYSKMKDALSVIVGHIPQGKLDNNKHNNLTIEISSFISLFPT